MADGDQTIVLTSETTPDTTQTIKNNDVWEKVITATYDADDTTDVSLALPGFNGTIRHITLAVPNTTNAITTQLQIQDNGNNVVFDTGEVAENATYNYSVDIPLQGTIDAVIGVSGAVGASGSVIVATIRGI
jgi:hypothetical protein